MPKCGHTLRRDVTANLLSTLLSLWLFHYKLGTRFNFSTTDVCFSDHHTPLSPSLSPSLSGCVPSGKRWCFLQLFTQPLKKHLTPDPELIFFFAPLLKASVLLLIKNWPANRDTAFAEYTTGSHPQGTFSGEMQPLGSRGFVWRSVRYGYERFVVVCIQDNNSVLVSLSLKFHQRYGTWKEAEEVPEI